MYESAVGDLLHGNGKDAFDAIGMLKAADPTKYSPRNGASYPNGAFGRSLMQIAQMIKANIGVEVAFAEIGGWDTHVNQGGAQGQLANRSRNSPGGLAALYQDLGDRMNDVVILTMSEFGPHRPPEWQSRHGSRSTLLVSWCSAGPVRGGKVYGGGPASPANSFLKAAT